MAQFTIYRSSDASAPVLTGEVGKLTALLYACLVTGYGVKSAAGWTRDFNGTNKSVFRGGAGTRLYLQVADDAPSTAKEARAVGYETMSDVNTGTGKFPTAAQLATALQIRKSTTADATARTWILVADNRTFYLFVQTGDSTNQYFGFGFGDFYSFKTGDAYNCMIIGIIDVDSGSLNSNVFAYQVGDYTSVANGHFMARGHTQLGSAVQFGVHNDLAKNSAGAQKFVGVVPYTNPEDGGVYICPIYIVDPTTLPIYGMRGRLRGLWGCLHPAASIPDATTFSGAASGELTGKTFLGIHIVRYGVGGENGTAIIETSNTLETN